MAIKLNGTELKYKILHNGGKLKTAYHNGVTEIWSADLIVIDNSIMETISELYRGAIGFNSGSYNSQSISTSNCTFTKYYGGESSDGFQWFCTPLIDVKGFTKCDITYSSPLLDSEYNTDPVTVGLSTTAPSGYVSTAANIDPGGFNDFSKTGISAITSQSKNGNNVTVTLEFSDIDQLSVVFWFYANHGVLMGKTKTIQIHKIKFYN